MKKLSAFQKLSWSLVLVAALAATALGLGHLQSQMKTETGSPLAGIGGPFTLQNQNGEQVSEAAFLGKPTLYFFGFTHCPDVCPTTLYELSQRLKELGPDGDKLNVAFVSVDPERDTVPELKQYLSAFDPRIVGLTGTQVQVDVMVKSYKIYAAKVPLQGGGYTLDHTASVFAANAKGRVIMLIGHEEMPDMVRAKLRRLLRQ